MIVKEAVYKTCPTCGKREMVKDSVVCCDFCKKILKETKYLNSTVFTTQNSEAVNYYFCSWKCFFKKMRNIKCNYFVSMPMLHYAKEDGVPASEFWKYIKKL
jgi:predicted nucleic acid-binding Zn ribbon protein